MMSGKYNISLSDTVWQKIDTYADRKQISKAEALRTLINVGLFVLDLQMKDEDVLVRGKDGDMMRIYLL